MISYVLVFMACLGNQCKPVNIPWDGSLMSCMTFGQMEISSWLAEHPNMTLGAFPNGRTGYKCDSGTST